MRLSLVKWVSFGEKWGTHLSDVAQRSINHHVVEHLVAVCRMQSWSCLMRPFYIQRKKDGVEVLNLINLPNLLMCFFFFFHTRLQRNHFLNFLDTGIKWTGLQLLSWSSKSVWTLKWNCHCHKFTGHQINTICQQKG